MVSTSAKVPGNLFLFTHTCKSIYLWKEKKVLLGKTSKVVYFQLLKMMRLGFHLRIYHRHLKSCLHFRNLTCFLCFKNSWTKRVAAATDFRTWFTRGWECIETKGSKYRFKGKKLLMYEVIKKNALLWKNHKF